MSSTLVFNAQTRVWLLTSNGIIAYTSGASNLYNTTVAYPSPAYDVTPERVPFDPVRGTGGSFWLLASGPDAGKYVSKWTNTLGYGSITVTSDYVWPADLTYPTVDPLADWRILIKGMGGMIAGTPVTTTAQYITINATTHRHFRASNGYIRHSTVPHPTIAVGGPYRVVKVVVPYDPMTRYGGSFWKMKEGPHPGWLISTRPDWLGEGDITITANSTTVTPAGYRSRGPGAVDATIYRPNAHLAGFSTNHNSPGELHFTLLCDDPNISVVLPKQTHATVEFWIGSAGASTATRRASYSASDWAEVWAGMIWDQDATDTETVFYGIDYLGLLQYCVDERFNPKYPKKPPPIGSYYTDQTIKQIVDSQLDYAIATPNSLVNFITRGATAAMNEKVTLPASLTQTLPFVVGLIESHRAGTGKNTRLSVNKTAAGGYEFVIVDNPGVNQDGKMLRYGDLVQGYRVIQFGKEWASRVNMTARAREGIALTYKSESSGVDQGEWGRIAQGPVVIETLDKNDLARRAKQAALDAARMGRQISVGLKLGSFRPRDDYDLCDNLPIDINHGSVSTKDWASDVFNADGAKAATGITGNATTNLITSTAHGLTANTEMLFTALTGGAGLSIEVPYFVAAAGLTASVFGVSATLGGAVIDFTTAITAGAWRTNSASTINANYWTIMGLSWESFDDGHWMTSLSLFPKGGGTALATVKRWFACPYVFGDTAPGTNGALSYWVGNTPSNKRDNAFLLGAPITWTGDREAFTSAADDPQLTDGFQGNAAGGVGRSGLRGPGTLTISTVEIVDGNPVTTKPAAKSADTIIFWGTWTNFAASIALTVDGVAQGTFAAVNSLGTWWNPTGVTSATPELEYLRTYFGDTRRDNDGAYEVRFNLGRVISGTSWAMTITPYYTQPASYGPRYCEVQAFNSTADSLIDISNPIVVPVESSTGWGAPPATTTSDTYTDLATGVVYNRNDDTEVYDVVPGTGSVVDFTFAALTQWVINHKMGGYPRVTLRDTGGVVIEAEVVYTSTTVITVNLSSAVAGSAHLG